MMEWNREMKGWKDRKREKEREWNEKREVG